MSFPGFALSISVAKTVIAITIGYGNSIFNGSFAVAINNLFSHVLISMDPTTQRIHVYVNDAPATLASGGWLSSGPFNFTMGSTWTFNASGSTAPGSGVGDVWSSNMPSFVDLGIVANRRKFINADLSPVDLGNTGSGPFGTQPSLFDGAPGDSNQPLDQQRVWWHGRLAAAAGVRAGHRLRHATATAGDATAHAEARDGQCYRQRGNDAAAKELISRWSDDRGHSWGSWVTQSIGEAGEYRTSLQWQRLAYARDRVFEISWSVPMRTALQGCWVDVTPAQS
jgi:hypothetical protein